MAGSSGRPERPSEWLKSQKAGWRVSEWFKSEPSPSQEAPPAPDAPNAASELLEEDGCIVRAGGLGIAVALLAVVKGRGSLGHRLGEALLIGLVVAAVVGVGYAAWWAIKALVRRRQYAALVGATGAVAYLVVRWPSHGAMDTYLLKAAFFGFKVWAATAALTWLWRHVALALSAFVSLVVAPTLAMFGAIVQNPHCLPTGDDRLDDALMCLLVSSTEPDLAIGELAAASTQVGLRGDSGAIDPIFAASGGGPDPLYQCMGSLYEDPAKRIEARAMSRFKFDHDEAHHIG